MNRDDLHRLATSRIADAKVLLAGKRWAGAYYLVGYAVECALKACILVHLGRVPELVFDDRRVSEKCWTHNLNQLVEIAGLKATLEMAKAADSRLRHNWEVVKDWKETSRYAKKRKTKTMELYRAITDKKHGVLSWIKARW